MCGIFGYYDRSGAGFEDARLRAMAECLKHRGPDDSGIHAGAHAAVGNRRLSIIDLAGGHQPFVSDDGRIVVVQNGEIFNHVELAEELARRGRPCRTRSDTEVILRLYEEEGIACLSRLNGMFAIAILDQRTDELFLARDRLGVKPLFVARDGARIIFASEIKALLAAGYPARLDALALDQFLTFNYVPLPRTMFQGVTHVAPGHYLRIGRSGDEQVQWWDLARIRPEAGRSESEWSERFLATLDDAVRIRMRSDVPFGAFLSGGIDSSTVVGLMSRHATEPVRTFCIGFDDERYDESAFAAEAAARFRTKHTSERVKPQMFGMWPDVLWHCDQPHGDASFMPTLRVSQLAVRDVKVVLTGDGGDELFAGYEKYRDFFADPAVMDVSHEQFVSRYESALTLLDAPGRSRLYRREFAGSVAGARAADVTVPLFERAAHYDRVTQALYFDVMQLLPGNNLVKPDRMGMAVSLEARTPFLDYRIVEMAFAMPGDLKLRNGELKYLYKRAVTPLIGENLAFRAKRMFTVPIGEWIRGELFAQFREALVANPRFVGDILERREVDRMLHAHRDGSANYTRELRALMAVELWGRRYFGPGVGGGEGARD